MHATVARTSVRTSGLRKGRKVVYLLPEVGGDAEHGHECEDGGGRRGGCMRRSASEAGMLLEAEDHRVLFPKGESDRPPPPTEASANRTPHRSLTVTDSPALHVAKQIHQN